MASVLNLLSKADLDPKDVSTILQLLQEQTTPILNLRAPLISTPVPHTSTPRSSNKKSSSRAPCKLSPATGFRAPRGERPAELNQDHSIKARLSSGGGAISPASPDVNSNDDFPPIGSNVQLQ